MRGMSDRIALILITVCLCRCDDTTLCVNHQLLPPWWMGDSTFPRRATGHQSSKAGRKGGQHRARRCHTTEQVTMDSESKGMFEASSWRTCSRWLMPAASGQGQAQKGAVLGYVGTSLHSIHLNGTRRKVPSYGHGKMDTRNGVTRQRSRYDRVGNHPHVVGGKDGSRSKCLE
jgi:hypothetical protein